MLCMFDRGERAATFLTCMVVLPLLALSVLSSIGMQKVSAQYAFAVLPALYILAAVLVISLVQVFHGIGLRALVLRLVPLAMVVFHMLGQDFMYFQKEYGWRPRWQEAVNYVLVQADEVSRREVCILTTNAPSVRYYVDPDRLRGHRYRTGKINVRSIEEWDLLRPEEFLGQLVASTRQKEPTSGSS